MLRRSNYSMVAIPSFIQGISTAKDLISGRTIAELSRNPFLYSGHFNLGEEGSVKLSVKEGRNPFFYSGHFNLFFYLLTYKNILMSQSLLLFRAFQLLVEPLAGGWQVASRNPFFYSGHFNGGVL